MIRSIVQKFSFKDKITLLFLGTCLSLWLVGMLGLGYAFTRRLEDDKHNKLEELSALVLREFEKQKTFLRVSASLLADTPSLRTAVQQRQLSALYQFLLPIKSTLELDLVKVVDTEGVVLVSLRQRELALAEFANQKVISQVISGVYLSSLLTAKERSQSALVGVAPFKPKEGVVGGIILGTAVSDELLLEIVENTQENLAAFNKGQLIASTISSAYDTPWQPPGANAPPSLVRIGNRGYLAKTVELSGLDDTTVNLVLLESIAPFERAKRNLWISIAAFSILGGAIASGVGAFTLKQVAVRDRKINAQMQELEKALLDLQQTQAQLIQTEKMSGLGQMIAGIAHEINNPVSFIHGNLRYATAYTKDLLELLQLYQQHYPTPVLEIQERREAIELDFLLGDLPKIISSMRVGTDRIYNIVLSLRNFSRLDEADMKAVNLHEGIESTLLILQHRLQEYAGNARIELIKDYGNLPLVQCYASQMNQVFMNILDNAIDALTNDNRQNQTNRILIRTELVSCQPCAANRVLIRIEDNGTGMPEDIRKRVFDPFFTTKPVGKGTGLGLSISYQIVVEKHGGSLQCVSKGGEGTTFSIEIPVCQSTVSESSTTILPDKSANVSSSRGRSPLVSIAP